MKTPIKKNFRSSARQVLILWGLVLWIFTPGLSGAYPLDAEPFTGIARLEGYRLAQEGKARARIQPPGALLPLDAVDLRLNNHPDLTLPPPDPRFTAQIKDLLGREADRYGIAVLDVTDPENPRYAEHRSEVDHNPGSIGKLVVAIGVFQALANIYPDDIAARQYVLRASMIKADDFIQTDHHKVPLWNADTGQMRYRPIQIGDTANFYTYLDWMLSASSNAAASMVIRELMLLVHFGKNYPVTEAEIDAFFRDTPKSELSNLLLRALQDPLTRNGFDTDLLRQGGFFTWRGKQRVPGTSSRANARILMQFLLKLEQGKIVDPFSSREIKRLLYMTQRRIRYASSPALEDAAVYFKSGSLYKCRSEPGFKCGKYMGNVYNLLNSVAIVEHPAGEPRLHYLVVVMSNVLRKNSAVAHQTLATRIQRLMEAEYPVAVPAGKAGADSEK
ncbi:MAG: serine hydrolase [Thermodesulfobacteriota bacterium]